MTVLNPTVVFPDFKIPKLDHVPDELKGYKQWTVWKLEQKTSDKKPRKVPYSPLGNYKQVGSTEDHRDSWGSFDDACNALKTGKFAGIQFALTESDPFVVVDIDHSHDHGSLTVLAEDLVKELDSYTELSPSGTGLHIFLHGKKPGDRCKKNLDEGEIEIYEKNRLMTVTGDIFRGHNELSQNQAALTELYYRIWPRMDEVKTPAVPVEPLAMDDNQLLEKIRRSKQGPKFDSLMAGDSSAYANKDNDGRSEAEMALCCILAYWTQKDVDRIDRIFCTSQLYRDKWNEPRSDSTYGRLTIDRAIDSTREVYNPSNVVPITSKKKTRKTRTVHIGSTGFKEADPIFKEPYPWPDIGSYYTISPVNGCLYIGQPGNDGEIIAMRPLWVDSIAEDEFYNPYRVLRFCDHNYKEQSICLPAEWFSKGKDMLVWGTLAKLGMMIMPGKEKYVARYIEMESAYVKTRSWSASKLGWFEMDPDNPVFILPENVIGNTDDDREIFFQNDSPDVSKGFTTSENLKGWQEYVAAPSKGNHMFMFVIMASLASCITKQVGVSTGGFHFWGLSSEGKTTMLQVAASVWGDGSDPQYHAEKATIRKWNNTTSGLEAIAQLHNDIVLCLDEIGEGERSEIGKIIYTLTGGTPKGRSKESGGLRSQKFWHTLIISSGEISSEQVLKEAGQDKKGGQVHRLPDINIDLMPDGIVQNSHGLTNKQLVVQLKKSCSRYFGTAGPVFASRIIALIKESGKYQFMDRINKDIAGMSEKLRELPKGCPPIPNALDRVLDRMAVIAVAGQYASEAGIINWLPHDIEKAVMTVRNIWLNDMEDGWREVDKALARLKENLIRNSINFYNMDIDDLQNPVHKMGYSNSKYIMVLPGVMDELCNNFSKKQVLKELDELGFLKKETAKKMVRKIPKCKLHIETPRCYWIDRNFLES